MTLKMYTLVYSINAAVFISEKYEQQISRIADF